MKKTKFKVGITFILVACLACSSVFAAYAYTAKDEPIDIVPIDGVRYGTSEHDENHGSSKANLSNTVSNYSVTADLATRSNYMGDKELNIKIRLWGEGNVGLINNGNPLFGSGNQVYYGDVSSFNVFNQGFFTITHGVYNTNNDNYDWDAMTQYIWDNDMLEPGIYNPSRSIG